MPGAGRIVVRPEQVAEPSPGHDPPAVRRQDLDERPRLSRPPGRQRHLGALDRDRERSQDRDGDRPASAVVPDRAAADGTWIPSRRRMRAASRARDRSVPSASGSRPISTSTRAAAGPAPPADQIDSASVSASRARAGSSSDGGLELEGVREQVRRPHLAGRRDGATGVLGGGGAVARARPRPVRPSSGRSAAGRAGRVEAPRLPRSRPRASARRQRAGPDPYSAGTSTCTSPDPRASSAASV